MKIKTIKIDSDVEAVLRAAKLDGNNTILRCKHHFLLLRQVK